MIHQGFAFVLTYLTLFVLTSSLPQQQNVDPSIVGLVNSVFNQNQNPTRAPPTRRPSSGFGVVVTPVPRDNSVPSQIFTSISGRAQCNCVPYHQCDPNTKTANPVDDGAFDGFGLIDIRFNKDSENAPSCEHFLDVCCDGERTHNNSLTPTPQEQRPNRPQGCGVRNVGGIDFNITGANDNEAGFGEFPWTVALLHSNNYSYFCAGSLIHSRVVLTAVHCVLDRPFNSFLIRAGEWDTQTLKERLPFEERGVAKVVTHPNYNYRNVANDYALVILKSSFNLGDHINVVCLPPANISPSPRTTCYSTGWGKDLFGAAGRYSAIMKRVPLPIVDFATCQNNFRNTRLGQRFALDRSFICAGGQRGIDTCQGDGGAPLVCPIGLESSQRYQQNGIVAWGIGCNDEIPAAYAHVALARDWIDDQMYSNGFDTTSYSIF